MDDFARLQPVILVVCFLVAFAVGSQVAGVLTTINSNKRANELMVLLEALASAERPRRPNRRERQRLTLARENYRRYSFVPRRSQRTIVVLGVTWGLAAGLALWLLMWSSTWI